ncbi:hypothetical protein FC92_GL001546 [Liquorilactobacillus hordei DSM 19519]|uniref:Uncharacterized protein n=2 Tax=Liquorilactobacillus hordei TaxID=468911 RepID=A0A0R1MA64_9LACO|nr:hypothetical protein FC92_GL001546 [Liquorilactobacillus hordei DSM 19519]
MLYQTFLNLTNTIFLKLLKYSLNLPIIHLGVFYKGMVHHMKKSLGKYIGKIVFSITLVTVAVLMVSLYISTTRLLTQRNLLSQQSAAQSLLRNNSNFKDSTQRELFRLAAGKVFNSKSFNDSDIKQVLKDVQNANVQVKYSGFATKNGAPMSINGTSFSKHSF